MKALISPSEVFAAVWVSAWEQTGSTFAPIYSSIEDCVRVAEVVSDDAMFEVHPSLQWATCPENCLADFWYYKDGSFLEKPVDVPMPTTSVVEMP